jgi:hypothetical protein
LNDALTFIGICCIGAYTDSGRPDALHFSFFNVLLKFVQPEKEANMKATRMLTALAVSTVFFNGSAIAQNDQPGAAASQDAQPATGATQEFRIKRVTPAYWRVTIDHPPFNIFGPESIPQLNSVITQIENDPELKVVVFDSAVPGFFLTHYDFAPPLEATTSMPVGPTGLPPCNVQRRNGISGS